MSHCHSQLKREMEKDMELTYEEHKRAHEKAYDAVMDFAIADIPVGDSSKLFNTNNDVTVEQRSLYFKAHGAYGEDCVIKDWYDNWYEYNVIECKVAKPKQYDISIDTFDRIKANCTKEEIIGGCKLNIDKYVWRKKGSDKEDLEKAKDYIDLWLWALDNK